MSDVITLPKPFSRTSARPVERESLFDSLAELQTYASTSPVAYAGQICAVSGTNTNIAYIINDNKTVSPLATEGTSSGKFLPLTGGNLTGNVFSTSTLSGNLIDTNVGYRFLNTAGHGLVLRGNGTNFVPASLSANDIAAGKALTTSNDTNVTLTVGGDHTVALLSAASITAGWTGQLAVSRGGTGTSTGSITGTGELVYAVGDGGNKNIYVLPSGTGLVYLPKVDINAGNIDNTNIGFTTPASGVFTGVRVAGDTYIEGSLFVAGSSTLIDTTNLIVSDPIIFLAEGNPDDSVDIGFTGAYNHNQAIKRHTGFIRDNSDGKWTLFSNLSSELLSAIQVPFSDPSLVIDTLRANIEGTVTGNVSGTALRADKLTVARTISAGGDVTYSVSFDGSGNVEAPATLRNNIVTYGKIQQVSANKILGNPTGSTANVSEIDCTAAGRAILDDATSAEQRTTLGVGTTNNVTFSSLTLSDGFKSINNIVYNASTASNNILTVSTFPDAGYNTAKFIAQVKNITSNTRAALEILATRSGGTWEGTVYAIVDPANIFVDVDVITSSVVELVFDLNGNSNYSITVFANAISD